MDNFKSLNIGDQMTPFQRIMYEMVKTIGEQIATMDMVEHMGYVLENENAAVNYNILATDVNGVAVDVKLSFSKSKLESFLSKLNVSDFS